MSDSSSSFAEAQLDLSDALFRFWLQPLQLTQAALAAGNALIAKAGNTAPAVEPAKPEVAQAVEERIAHLDDEIDRTVPQVAAVVV